MHVHKDGLNDNMRNILFDYTLKFVITWSRIKLCGSQLGPEIINNLLESPNGVHHLLVQSDHELSSLPVKGYSDCHLC